MEWITFRSSTSSLGLQDGEMLTILFQPLPSKSVPPPAESTEFICLYATLSVTYGIDRKERKK